MVTVTTGSVTSFTVSRVPLPMFPAASVCEAVTVTTPTGSDVALIAAAVHAPPLQVGTGATAIAPIVTETGKPDSEHVPVTPL